MRIGKRSKFYVLGFMAIVCLVGLFCVIQRDSQIIIEGPKTFGMAASVLRDIRLVWIDGGRSDNFAPSNHLRGMYSDAFHFTNSVNVKGKEYHCCFGVRDNYWPAGLLVIAEDGTILWIRGRDGAVTVSPQRKRVEP